MPLYQRVAEDARRMRQLGMSFDAIGRALGTDGHVAKKAVAWALGPNAAELKPPPARFKEIAAEALELNKSGWSLRQIGRHFGLSAPMVMSSLAWARKQRRRQGGEG